MSKRPIIALDAGHGLHTPGKRCLKAIDPAETREWILNARVADLTQALLSAYDCTVIRVDDTTGARDISLAARVKAANDAGADIYIAPHHNAGINGGIGGGTVVYYCSSEDERRVQAMHLYDAITARTGLIGNRSSKVIKRGFYVIKNTRMPAFLIENGFMDSRTDTPIILTQAHAERTAQGIVDFLVAELDLRTSQEGSQQPQTGGSTAVGGDPPHQRLLSGLYRPQDYLIRRYDIPGTGCQLCPPQADRQSQQYHRIRRHSCAKYQDVQSAGGWYTQKRIVATSQLFLKKG